MAPPPPARPITPCGLRAASALQVAPAAVEFAAFERGPCYVAALSVRNASDRVLRFRLTPPRHASPFRVLLRGRDLARSENGTVTLPPGLSVTYEVAFQQPGEFDAAPGDDQAETESASDVALAIIHDALQLRGNDGSVVDVPLVARRACPLLELTPALCELGFVVLTQRAARFIEVRNSGARAGRFVIDVLDASSVANGSGAPTTTAGIVAPLAAISATPLRGRLAPGEIANVKVEAQGLEVGAFRSLLRVRIWELNADDQEEDDDAEESNADPADAATRAVDMDNNGAAADKGPRAATEKIVDVVGSIVEHTTELVLQRGLEPVQSLFFGSLFAGETRSVETLLRNNGPQPLVFKASVSFGSGGVGSASGASSGSSGMLLGTGLEEDREAYERRKELRVTPADGCVEPFSEIPVTFVYRPRPMSYEAIQRLDRKQLGDGTRDTGSPPSTTSSNNDADSSGADFTLLPAPAQQLSAFASISCSNLQTQNLTFEVSAKTFTPRVQLAPSPPLDFGDVRSHDRADLLLSLKNLSGLPVRFEVVTAKAAHFSVCPQSGRLDVLQSQSLVVSFTPTQLGSFRSILPLRINGDVLEIPVAVCGRAAAVGPVPPSSERLVGGPLALPADFAPQYKFLLPEEAKRTKGRLSSHFRRQPPHELAALNGTAALDEFEFQGTNNTHLTYCVKELARRADHRAAYHEYLATCRKQREAKAKGIWRKNGKAQGLKASVAQARGNSSRDTDGGEDDRLADSDVDLGMEREKRPQPQELRLPASLVRPNDPLWLSQHPSGGGAGASSRAKLFFDEHKLIKKKFKLAPVTPAELADCGRVLEFDELEQVVSGPKTLNFGRLSVNGSAVRSLTVQNNLSHSVLVTLHLGSNSSSAHDSAPRPLDELRKTPLTAQVVPPRARAGFDLVFCSSREQFFQQPLTYSLNGAHPRQATVVAEVAPIVVELAPEELRFEFSALDLSTSAARDVILTNTSESEAPFTWSRQQLLATPDGASRPDSSKSNATTIVTTVAADKPPSNAASSLSPVFEIFPASGTLAPSATLLCKVVFTPPCTSGPGSSALGLAPGGGAAWLSQSFQLDVTGGEKAALNCRALLPEVKVVARDKRVDFGTISVGVEREKRITLANMGATTRAIFYVSVDPPAMSTSVGLRVSPAVGAVNAQDTVELTVTLLPHRSITLEAAGGGTTSPGSQQASIVVALRGGKVLRLPVSATVLVPDVSLSPTDVVDFGEVVLGVAVPRVLSLENHSSIAACLILNLGASTLTDEFALATPPRLLAHLEDASSIFVPLTEAGESEKLQTSDKLDDKTVMQAQEDASIGDARCSKWQVCLPPHATVSCHLVFTPRRAGNHDALLPLHIAGVAASSGANDGSPPPLQRRVIARAIVPRLRFSSATLHFQRCVITREGIRKVPYTKQLVLTNADTQPLRWHIDTARLRLGNLVAFAAGAVAAASTPVAGTTNSSNALAKRVAAACPTSSATAVVFHIAPDRGELAPGEEAVLRVSFLPLDAVEYAEDELPLLVDDEPYVHLSLRGEGIHPHLSFSTNRVVLPTVPLGVTARARFLVCATGYDHLELTCRVPLDTTRAPLSVLFPLGKTLSMACPTIPVELRFCSTQSVAFNARLEFFDADGNIFTLPVSGCADNCLFTNYGFLQSHGLAAEPSEDAMSSPRHRKELAKLETGDNATPGENHTGPAIVKGATHATGGPPGGYEFYTHASGRFPVYLLSSSQAQIEHDKVKDHAASPQSAAANGFVVVDPSTGLEDDTNGACGSAPSPSASFLPPPQSLAASGVTEPFSEGEIQLVMQYLNANFLRTTVTRFPHDFADNAGRPLYELLDMVCTKKPGGLAIPTLRAPGAGGVSNTGNNRKNGNSGAGSTSANGGHTGATGNGLGVNATTSSSMVSGAMPAPSKRDQLTQYTAQFTELLRFLRSYGAMVHDIFPEHLLAQEFYLRACESPQADPALLSSPSLAAMPFVARRRALESEWPAVSATAWMKVLYQVIKCFLLSRITWKSYQQQQLQLEQQQKTRDATVATAAGNVANASIGGKRKGDKMTTSPSRACQGSNVYSEAEMVLLQWTCDSVRSLRKQQQQHSVMAAAALPHGVEALENQLLDIGRDLRDGRWLFHLVAAHIPTLSVDQSAYQCFRWSPEAATRPRRPLSAAQLQHHASVLLQTLGAFGVDFGMDPTRFLRRFTSREMLVLLLHLQQTLPQFIPKATIEFRGGLGQVMEKSIELKNPSARPLRYHVFLDSAQGVSTGIGESGAAISEFTIESSDLVLEPGKTVAFVVTFRPRFSRKITARLVFQAVRGDAGSPASVSSGMGGGGGATMVFLLESNIVSRKPVRVIQIETKTYEKRIEELVIDNQFPANATYKLSMTQQQQPSSSLGTGDGALGAVGGGGQANATGSGALPASRGSRRRTAQDRASPSQAITSTSNFVVGGDNMAVSGKKHGHQSTMSGKHRGEDADFSWCLQAQQPFYLPDFGTSGSSSSAANINGDSSPGTEGSGSLLAPPSGLGMGGGAAVAIRKGGSTKVKLEFLPLLPGHYRCQLLFLDEHIGEFLYEIHAVAHLPASLETLELQCEASTAGVGGVGASNSAAATRFHFMRELTIPVKNPPLTRALAVFVDRANGHLRTKLKEGLKRCEENHHSHFHVDFNSPFFSAALPELILTHTGTGGKPPLASGRTDSSGADPSAIGSKPLHKANQARLGTPRSTIAGTNSVIIDFQPKGAGRYACKLLLRSRHTLCGSSDVRVYDLIAKVKEPNVKTQLEFVAPARHSIVQEIPLSNPTDASWALKAIFSSSNGSGGKGHTSMFSGPPTMVVPAKRSATYPLTFTPTWISHETSSFALVNTATHQQFDFELSGYGEEPLAQDHVVLACQARASVVHEFTVFALPGGNGPGTDATGQQVFKVESDLRDVVGESTIVVPAGTGTAASRSVKYPLTFSPLVSGSYFGSVTFTNEATREYLWYTVEAAVSPPEPEATLEMRATIRGAVGVEIRLGNPLENATTFNVELRGRGLLGPEIFTLEARQAGVYELVYSPLLVTSGRDGEEGAILFASDAIGQFWYRLQLVAEPAAAQQLDDMCCAVGDVCSQPLWLQNPSDRELALQYRVTNTRNFSIKGSNSSAATKAPTRVVLPPFGRASVVVEYTPSSLSDFESTSVIFFESEVVSDWEFAVRGRGRAPSVMKPLVVTARVREAASTLFSFKNPFAAPLRVDVKLVAEGSASDPNTPAGTPSTAPVFDMLLKKRRVLLESFALLQVPISFLPRAVSETHAELVIRGSDEYAELEWHYPLRGVAEAPLHPRSLAVLACQARDAVEKRVECELLAAPADMVLADERFLVEWEIAAERFGPMASAAAIERALTVTPLPLPPAGSSALSRSGGLNLPYLLRFEPLRPYRGSVALLIRKKSGGLWRFEVALDAGEPPVDDVLAIESSLNQTSSVSFQLRNQFRESAAFKAEFSAGSSSAFTVYPAEGELPPYGSDDGATFVVSFTPTGYGKMQSGQLVIYTEEMQWTFNVKGTYPDATASSKGSGPASSLSLSSSASRARLGISAPATSSGNSSGSGSKSNVGVSAASGARRQVRGATRRS